MALSNIEQLIVDTLRTVARTKDVIAYGELNRRVPLNLNLSLRTDRNRLSAWVGGILRHEVGQGRVALPALVVFKDSSDPGPGFFTVVDDLGLRLPNEDNAAVHLRLLRDVHAYYTHQVSSKPSSS